MKWVLLPLLSVFAYCAWRTQASLPFYNAWDMDFITVMDLFQMGDGILPQHVNHPGLGLYLIQRWLWPLGQLSATNLTQLLAAPVPLLSAAEATEWARGLTFLPATLVVGGCVWGLSSAMPKKPGMAGTLALFAIVVSLAGLWGFQLHQIRSELYAMGFYCLAFALIGQRPLVVLVVAGLAFLTKIQGLFLHFALVLQLWESLPPSKLPRLPERRLGPALALGFFLVVCVWSWCTYMPSYFALFAPKKKPNIFFWLTFLTLLLPFIASPLGRIWTATVRVRKPSYFRFARPDQDFLSALGLPYLAVIGLLLSFGFHFLAFPSPLTSFEYLLFDWRMIFLKVSHHNTVQSGFWEMFRWNLSYHALVFVAWGVACALTWPRLEARKQRFVIAHTLLVLAAFFIVSRGRVQDSLWNDVLILWGFRYLLPAFELWRPSVLPISALALIGWNVLHLQTLPYDGIEASPPEIEAFWDEPYESPVNQYAQVMAKLKSDPWVHAQTNRLAQIHRELRQAERELWESPAPDLRHLSLASREFDDYVVVVPRKTESTIRPRWRPVWLGAPDVENLVDCPLTPQVVQRGDVRWRQVRPGTKKCKLLSKRVSLAFNFKLRAPTP